MGTVRAWLKQWWSRWRVVEPFCAKCGRRRETLDLHPAIIARVAGALTYCFACVDARARASGLNAVWRVNVSASVWDAWSQTKTTDRSVALNAKGVMLLGGDTVTQVPWRFVIQADVCAYCNGPGGTMDHIQPQAFGGADNASNLTGACVRCNQRKGTMPMLMYLGFL